MLNIKQIIENIIPSDDHKYIMVTSTVVRATFTCIGEPSGGRPTIEMFNIVRI